MQKICKPEQKRFKTFTNTLSYNHKLGFRVHDALLNRNFINGVANPNITHSKY